jgi:hypothetical protein
MAQTWDARDDLARQAVPKLPTLAEYRAWIGVRNCRYCGELLPDTLAFYPHRFGWQVDGMDDRQWLSIVCATTSCQYQWSIATLGMPRPVAGGGG